jgi:hypothetical protein
MCTTKSIWVLTIWSTKSLGMNYTAHLAALGLIPLASTSPHALRAVDRAFHSVRYTVQIYMQNQVSRCDHCIPHQVIWR